MGNEDMVREVSERAIASVPPAAERSSIGKDTFICALPSCPIDNCVVVFLLFTRNFYYFLNFSCPFLFW